MSVNEVVRVINVMGEHKYITRGPWVSGHKCI